MQIWNGSDKYCWRYRVDTILSKDGQMDRRTDGPTDGQGETSIRPFQLCWSRGYDKVMLKVLGKIDWYIATTMHKLCIYFLGCHYSDVIMSPMASQITRVSIVYSTLCSGTDQRKHQSFASRAFMRGIHRWIPCTKASDMENVSICDVIMYLLCVCLSVLSHTTTTKFLKYNLLILVANFQISI